MRERSAVLLIWLLICGLIFGDISDNVYPIKNKILIHEHTHDRRTVRLKSLHPQQKNSQILYDNFTEIINQNWETGIWINRSRTIINTGSDPEVITEFLNQLESSMEATAEDPRNILYAFLDLDLIPNFYYLNQIWNGNDWQDQIQIISETDKAGLLSKLIFQSAGAGLLKSGRTMWNNVLEAYLTHDNKSYLTELLLKAELKEKTSVTNVAKFNFSYNTEYYPTRYSASLYIENKWIESFQILFYYDDYGFPIKEIAQTKYPILGWTDVDQILRTFDEQGNVLTFMKQINPDIIGKASITPKIMTDWLNTNLDEFEWDASSNMTEHIYSYWENNIWNLKEREYLKYDECRLKSWLFQTWNNGWDAVEQELTQYDANDDPVIVLYQIKNGLWKDKEKQENTFQNHLLKKTVIYEKVNNEWIRKNRVLWNNGNIVYADYFKTLPRDYSIVNFPNPFNSTTQIIFELNHAARVDLSVYDELGRRITTLLHGKQMPGIHCVTYYAGHLSSGIYLTVLSVDNNVDINKMILLK
ncbi:T9SS type A sorting domain-containing protein [bacterium]|nr:T9SS type A sorting domain-containing protein [bacterium]